MPPQVLPRTAADAAEARILIAGRIIRRLYVELTDADRNAFPVLIAPPREAWVYKPWVTLFLDSYSRLVMGWALSLRPGSATVPAAMGRGFIVDVKRGPFGGVPQVLVPDNGLEFIATTLGRVCAVPGSYAPSQQAVAEKDLLRRRCRRYAVTPPGALAAESSRAGPVGGLRIHRQRRPEPYTKVISRCSPTSPAIASATPPRCCRAAPGGVSCPDTVLLYGPGPRSSGP